MPTSFAAELLGWKAPTKGRKFTFSNENGYAPNTADTASDQSYKLAAGVLNELDIAGDRPSDVPSNPGNELEMKVCDFLRAALSECTPHRDWHVHRGTDLNRYAQYQHLDRFDSVIQGDPTLRVTLGDHYLIKPDVTVSLLNLPILNGLPLLHAAISCKWTMRSDRVQNVRHEFNQMVRYRRGRQPHLVVVTAEPMPTRLLAITRGTGEVDAVYHIAFDALAASVERHGNAKQRSAWDECVSQGRLVGFDQLAVTLASW